VEERRRRSSGPSAARRARPEVEETATAFRVRGLTVPHPFLEQAMLIGGRPQRGGVAAVGELAPSVVSRDMGGSAGPGSRA
jgi:hypothetical protein